MRNFQSYPAKITQEEGQYTVFFRDLPNTFTYGDTYGEALENAKEVLELMVEEMIKDEEEFNPPSARREDEVDIFMPFHLSFSLLLRTERKRRGLTQAQLAELLGVTQQQEAKLEKPSQERKINTIVNVLDKMGYTLQLRERDVEEIRQ